MKKWTFLFTALFLTAVHLPAQPGWETALPLLQKKHPTQAENQRILSLFRSAKDPDAIFASGASLVKNPPSKIQEPVLFNLILKDGNPLKQTFSAIIITAMGSSHEELLPLIQNALESKDALLRSYAAGAYAILNPQDKKYTAEIVHLYAFDPAFAIRAMNLLTDNSKQQFKYLKQASSSPDAQTRSAAAAWLSALHTQNAAKQLLKMAKKESDPNVQTQIATGLAANRSYTLPDTAKGLRRNYNHPSSATYALALGFMTGNAIDTIRQGLNSSNQNERINSARAAAYMAGVLSNPDAFNYTSDRVFDTGLLKSLIPQLKILAATEDNSVKIYAENALRQIEKLMV